jgi:hypothetical protein
MPVPQSRFIGVNIRRVAGSQTRRSFGTVLFAAYLTWFVERVRTYSDASEMLDDGCPETAPEYLAALTFCAQENRPPTFKVGRREGAPTQSLRFTPSAPVEGEEYSLSIRGVAFAVTADSTPSVAEICAALTLLINADPDAIIASGVNSAITQQVLDSGDFNGVRGDGPFTPPRNVTLTLNAHADWDATNATVVGKDAFGRSQSETFAIPNGGGTTLVGTKVWSEITTITIPAQTGTNGTLLVGLGQVFAEGEIDVTAVDGTTHVDVTADDVGAWYPYTDVSTNLAIEDRTAEPATTLATDLEAIEEADADWYGLDVVDAQSAPQILAAAAWIEGTKRKYIADSLDTNEETADDDGVGYDLRELSRLDTVVAHSRRNHDTFLSAAIFGRMFGFEPGSAVFQFKTLRGVRADEYSTTVLSRLHGPSEAEQLQGKRVIVYSEVRARGTNVGTAVTIGSMSAGGEHLHNLIGLDACEAELETQGFELQLANPKIPYTRKGIALFEGKVTNVLRRFSREPYQLFDESTIIVSPTALEDVTTAERQAGTYNGVAFDVQLQGAILHGRFNGTVR